MGMFFTSENWLYRKTRRWLFEWPQPALVLGLTALGALMIAYHSQYVFGFQPCSLCLWQRGPLWAVVLVAALALLGHPGKRWRWIFVACMAVLFGIEAGIAFFHVGVEQHWWQGLTGCNAASGMDATSVEAMRAQLMETLTARCDKITWTLFGLSMATWNVPFSLVLAIYSAFAARRLRSA